MLVKLIILILLSFSSVKCANILAVFHNPARSHFSLGRALLEGLAAKGHQVTMLSPFAVNNPLENYESIEVTGLQLSKDDGIKRLSAIINGTIFDKLTTANQNFQKINRLFLNHSTVKDLLNSNRKFDLVIFDWIFNEAFLGIAHHFNAYSVVFSSFTSSQMINKVTGNPAPYAYVPNIMPAVSDDMTFSQRVANTIGNLFIEFKEFFFIPAQNSLLHEHFPKAPHVKELLRNVSLVLVNSHIASETSRPYVPNMIPVAGLHLREPKELEGELKTFMDEATEGVLYFSFGSTVKSSEISVDKLQAIIRTFSKLPVRVLWKFEGDNVPKLPANVKIAKWFPQRDILAHPNMRAFVTQGGILSVFETLYHGIPLVAMPFHGDQEANAQFGVSKGYAVKLDFQTLTEKSLTHAITEVLNNPKYRQNAQERSRWLRDQPMKPLDKAVYWVEYVLRHKGAHHLRTAALDLWWYQYFLLDVFAFLLAIPILACVMLKSLFKLSRVLFSKQFEIIQMKILSSKKTR